ncbi:MAG: hypothetical protein ACXWWU_02545 [Candidatus Limnocylindria bacterium]
MTTHEPTTQPGRESRSLLYIGAGILALLVISVVIVLAIGRTATPDYPADSPEGTLQRYFAAFEEGDYEGAYEYFSARVKEQMSVDDFRRSIGMYQGGAPGGQRVLFQGTSGEGDRVRVELVIEYFYDDGFGGGSSSQPRQISMVREDGEWRIDDALAGLEPAMIDAPF